MMDGLMNLMEFPQTYEFFSVIFLRCFSIVQ